MPRKNLSLKKSVPAVYSPGVWIAVIILAFVVGFLFTFLANKMKNQPTQENMISIPYTGAPNRYN